MKLSVTLPVVICTLITFSACGPDKPAGELLRLNGEAQGTYYHIILVDAAAEVASYQAGIDSVFAEIDQAFSTYLDTSLISRFNFSDSGIVVNEIFLHLLDQSRRLHRETGGAFDPTVAPLVEAYGFGPSRQQHPVDSQERQRLLSLVGLEKITRQGKMLKKPLPEMKLDFNAIAQGYTVDAIAAYLDAQQIEAYMVEVGGELKAKGTKAGNDPWVIGIDKPEEEAETVDRQLQLKLKLENKALATSGNYRKFYLKDGQKITHTIDPKSGMTMDRSLLSATVITDSCAVADGLATAFMVMGKEKTVEFLEDHKDIHGILIFSDEKGYLRTYISPGIADRIMK